MFTYLASLWPSDSWAAWSQEVSSHSACCGARNIIFVFTTVANRYVKVINGILRYLWILAEWKTLTFSGVVEIDKAQQLQKKTFPFWALFFQKLEKYKINSNCQGRYINRKRKQTPCINHRQKKAKVTFGGCTLSVCGVCVCQTFFLWA